VLRLDMAESLLDMSAPNRNDLLHVARSTGARSMMRASSCAGARRSVTGPTRTRRAYGDRPQVLAKRSRWWEVTAIEMLPLGHGQVEGA
jgi:hypothetical protein